MLDSSKTNRNGTHQDMKSLLKDAHALLNAATALSGEKAEEMHQNGMRLLDTALGSVHDAAHDAQASTVAMGKEIGASANGYVKAHPWSTIAAAASVGLAVGVMLGHGHNGQDGHDGHEVHNGNGQTGQNGLNGGHRS